MTKAERIFSTTRFECKKHLDAWGYEVNPDGSAVGFNFVTTDEVVCVRTLNDMDKQLIRLRREYEIAKKYGVITEAECEYKNQILDMVESTIKNTRKTLAS